MGIEIEDTYCEAFGGLFARFIITAKTKRLVKKAARSTTALPSSVFGRIRDYACSEGGVEGSFEGAYGEVFRWLNKTETPDKRWGAIVQIWVADSKEAVKKLEEDLGWRIRQGTLVVPTTSIFNALDSKEKIDMMDKVGHCGGGVEFEEAYLGRQMINIPIMMGKGQGQFRIERWLGYAKGIEGGNIWIMAESVKAGLIAGDKALKAIHEKVGNVITSFDLCSAGSRALKEGDKYPELGPPSNDEFCPVLKGKITCSKVPEGVNSIPEIVINGPDLESVKKAMRLAAEAALEVKGVLKISTGNYGGRLGKYKIPLKEIFE